MKALVAALATSALLVSAAGYASAQPDQRGHEAADQQHSGWAKDQGAGHQWKRGERMGYNDWNGAQPVDYRQHHLRQPPAGYEWRESNGAYVMAAIATGIIASSMVASGR